MKNTTFLLRLYAFAFFSDFFLVFSVDKLIFKANGLSVWEIAVIISCWGGIRLLAEIPSGILADVWNRKYMLILSGFFSFLCYLSWCLFPNFFGFLLGFSLFYALSLAFLSGTDQAYIYDYLTFSNQTDNFEKIYGHFRSIRIAGVALAWLLGGYVSEVTSYSMVIYLAMGSGFITTILGYFLPNVPQVIPVEIDTPYAFFKSSVHYLINNSKLLTIFILALTIGSSYQLIDEYWSVYYNWFGLSTSVFGVLVFLSSFLGSITGMFIHKMKASLHLLSLLSLCVSLIILSAGLVKSIFIIPFMMLLDSLMNILGIVSHSIIQRNTPDDKRATIASTISFSENIFLVTGLGFGWIVDHFSLQQGYLFIACICSLYFISPFFTILFKKFHTQI